MVKARILDGVTVAEYLEGEKDSEVRHEYLHGEIYAHAGASITHNLISGNIFRVLAAAADETTCRVYASDMKVRIEESVFYYPDVMVVCKAPTDEYYESEPCVIVEVLSESTSRKDRFEKRLAYQTMPSLELYLLVDSRKRKVTGYYRTPEGWLERTFGKEEAIDIPCLATHMPYRALYQKTSLQF